MIRRSIIVYYYFGTCVRYLQDASQGVKIHEKGHILENIANFLAYLKTLQLSVTSRVIQPLISLKMKFSKIKDDRILSQEERGELTNVITDIRQTLEAELEGIKAFSVTSKRIDVQRLIDDVPSLFAPKTFIFLPVIARYDFTEAGKCIAFERPTAAAFHILRGIEGFLKHFYLFFIRQNRVKKLMWGPIVEDLRNRIKTRKYETLYNNLDHMRLSYRNPTQHPEMLYDIHEAQDLWGLCVETVNRMARILKAGIEKKKRKII